MKNLSLNISYASIVLSFTSWRDFCWNNYVIVAILLCFYLFITSKSRNFNLITSIYVVLSFAFVVCATQVLLSVDYSRYPFISMLILFVLLPTFFLVRI